LQNQADSTFFAPFLFVLMIPIFIILPILPIARNDCGFLQALQMAKKSDTFQLSFRRDHAEPAGPQARRGKEGDGYCLNS
jgi:hypothetical protein